MEKNNDELKKIREIVDDIHGRLGCIAFFLFIIALNTCVGANPV